MLVLQFFIRTFLSNFVCNPILRAINSRELRSLTQITDNNIFERNSRDNFDFWVLFMSSSLRWKTLQKIQSIYRLTRSQSHKQIKCVAQCSNARFNKSDWSCDFFSQLKALIFRSNTEFFVSWRTSHRTGTLNLLLMGSNPHHFLQKKHKNASNDSL